MIRICFFVLSLLCSLSVFAQQKGYLYLLYTTPDKQPVAYLDISITDVADNSVQHGISDKNGKLNFIVVAGHKYLVQASGDPINYEIVIPLQGYPVVTRNFILPATFISNQTDTIWQEISEYQYPDANSRRVVIRVLNDNRDAQARVPVRLHLPALKRVYYAYTSYNGEALFNIPYSTVVYLGIDTYGAVLDINLPQKQNVTLTQQITFQPSPDVDQILNDTILQNFSDRISASTDRVLVKIRLFDFEGNVLQNEPVFFNLSDSSLVYKTNTNEQGEARLLLPKGQTYVMNLKYERDIDIFDYPYDFSSHTTQVDMSYIGSAKVEEFYQTTNRNANGLITEFMESRVMQLSEFEANKTTTEYGLKFNPQKSSSHISTPLLFEGNMYFSGGYYSKEFYATTTNGQFLWGLALADNGPSAVTYAEGYIIIITESCSLYIINARTGELAWSKWLGPDMFHVPTVGAGKVFVSYPNATDAMHLLENKETYAMVAFDLEDGSIVWQQPISSEILGAAVFAEPYLYTTTQDGNLYRFDASDGKAIKNDKLEAVSMPTISGKNLYISTSDSISSKVCQLSTESLSIQMVYKELNAEMFNKEFLESGPSLMAYDKLRNICAKGSNYISMGNKLIKYDPVTGKVIWSSVFLPEPGSFTSSALLSPVLAGNSLIVGTENGLLHVLDASTGKILQKINIEGELYCQPVVVNNLLAVGSNKGMLHLINKLKITGNWPMWNLNASHNTVIN